MRFEYLIIMGIFLVFIVGGIYLIAISDKANKIEDGEADKSKKL